MTDHLAEAERLLRDWNTGVAMALKSVIAHLRASQPATETAGERPDCVSCGRPIVAVELNATRCPACTDPPQPAPQPNVRCERCGAYPAFQCRCQRFIPQPAGDEKREGEG